MLAALLLCAATVTAAATPGIALAVGDLSDAGRRADMAALATRATVLAQSLADERDTLAVFAAAGRPAAHGPGLTAGDRERADREVRDVTTDAPAAVRTALAGLSGVRDGALTGRGDARSVVTAYQPLIDALGQVSGPSTAPLGRAVDAASAQRALLVSALTAGGPQPALVAAAQTARLQEQAALAEFRATAPAALRGRYDRTVSGPDADRADHDLGVLLGSTELTPAGRSLGAPGVDSALSARLSLMRSVEASAATDEAHAAAGHRRHQVTVLELRIALAALCLLLVVGVLVNLFRSITRPLAALHRWARSDPEGGEGAKALGNDEFAAVARRINALTQEAQALRGRSQELTAERAAATEAGTALAAEREGLLRTQQDLLRSREELAGRLTAAAARTAAQVMFVNLSLRTLGLVERQLALIEGMEDQEQDPDRLEGLFRLDHLATRMRRNSENLLVLTGTEHAHGATARPVALIDVARAAVSEIERYERVRIDSVPDAKVAGRAADDVGHLVAELLDNATAFSDPAADIRLSGWLMETGEVMLSVSDTGIGIPATRLDALNDLLADPDPAPPGAATGMGLYVVARLAHRHGVRVQLRPHARGGTAAVVVLPQLLLPLLDPQAPPVTPVTPLTFSEADSLGDGLPLASAPYPEPAPPARGSAAAALSGFPGPRAAESLPGHEHVRAPHEPHAGRPAPAPRADEPAPPADVPPGQGPGTGAGSGDVARGAVLPGALPPAGAPVPSGPTPTPTPGRPPLPSRRAATAAADAAPADAFGHAPTVSGTAPDAVSPPAPASAAPPAPPASAPPAADGSVTAMGLPQRVPRTTGWTGGPEAGAPGAAPDPRASGPVDADRLRRRLGGLQQGLQAGREEAERETERGTGATVPRSGPSPHPGGLGEGAGAVDGTEGTEGTDGVESPAATEEATR
ncbi:Histidine kinase-, DNA gyrase B-, and HSP90-like ATPase [Actinacidiphila rubida]|uniref:histidine kinase n=3 Tax=Actinacidiphila rubida TaxID=310780 RepID=A0A1H8U2M2_9ACTN|nr:Histidine kinase-, DNA gyrase B-, and HSP90-like ATPase [Actinacidiphila rubida]